MRIGDDPFRDKVDFTFKSRVEQRAPKDVCADCFTVLTLKKIFIDKTYGKFIYKNAALWFVSTDILTGRGFYLSKGKQKTGHLFTLSVERRHSINAQWHD